MYSNIIFPTERNQKLACNKFYYWMLIGFQCLSQNCWLYIQTVAEEPQCLEKTTYFRQKTNYHRKLRLESNTPAAFRVWTLNSKPHWWHTCVSDTVVELIIPVGPRYTSSILVTRHVVMIWRINFVIYLLLKNKIYTSYNMPWNTRYYLNSVNYFFTLKKGGKQVSR